jgi:hypothetical protein
MLSPGCRSAKEIASVSGKPTKAAKSEVLMLV